MGMDSLTTLINKLQGVCTLMGDNAGSGNKGGMPGLWNSLPQIVVIGGQSSGKSSVLESVVGRDFLPRGSGIVTRRPLVLQLVQEPVEREYGEFLHAYGKRFYDVEEIRKEIDAETFRKLGQGIAVSPDPIQLTYHGANVPNLTLVDMPGLTKFAIKGQPDSIVADIENMARKYIESENVIILAVTPANADLATSEAIRLAREVDPDGKRTIGVLTKLDLMDKGTDARGVLEGKDYPLQQGWSGVVNRSQHDIDTKVSMPEARKQEKEFFANHPKYGGLDNMGFGYLTDKLSKELMTAIEHQVPKIRAYVNEAIGQLEKRLVELGEDACQDRGVMLHTVIMVAREFETSFAHVLMTGAGGGEKIRGTVFDGALRKQVLELPVAPIFSTTNVQRTVSQADGYQNHLVAPEAGYRKLIEQGVRLLKDPCTGAVDSTHDILSEIMEAVSTGPHAPEALQSYPGLRSELVTFASAALTDLKTSTLAIVDAMVEMEVAHLEADFFRSLQQAGGEKVYDDEEAEEEAEAEEGGEDGGKGPSAANPARAEATRLQLRDGSWVDWALAAGRIGRSCRMYVDTVSARCLKTVPKAIVYYQVEKARKNVLQAFYAALSQMGENDLRQVLAEDAAVVRERAECTSRLELLSRARDEITLFSR